MKPMLPIALLLLSGAAISALAPNIALATQPADLSPLLSSILAKHTAPGIVAAVVEDGQITALGAAGVRKAGSAAALTPYDLIHLGSDTKAMTAVLIGQLIDKRQLAFGSTIAQVFPDLAARMNAAMAKVTVQELLCHTGGWIVADRPWADGTAYTHSGSNTMCFCTAWIAPGKNFATLVPINYGGEDAFQTCDEATGALIQFHESHSGGGR